jgi:NitT/TauT family transport system substrate-binding protein
MKDAAAILLEAGVIRSIPNNFDAMYDTSFLK